MSAMQTSFHTTYSPLSCPCTVPRPPFSWPRVDLPGCFGEHILGLFGLYSSSLSKSVGFVSLSGKASLVSISAAILFLRSWHVYFPLEFEFRAKSCVEWEHVVCCLFSSYCVDFLLASLYLNRFTSLDNDDNDVEVALPLGGSRSAWFLVELEFGNVGFWGEGKTEVPGEKPLRAKERTNTSRHSWGSQVFTTSMRLF